MPDIAPTITLSLGDDHWPRRRPRPPLILDLHYNAAMPMARLRLAAQPYPSRRWSWKALTRTLRDAMVRRVPLTYSVLQPSGTPYGTEQAWLVNLKMTGAYELLTELSEDGEPCIVGHRVTRVDTCTIELIPEPAVFGAIYHALRSHPASTSQ